MRARKNHVIKFKDLFHEVESNEVLYATASEAVTSKKAMLEVPVTHEAWIIKNGGEVKQVDSGKSLLFETKEDIKNWKKGFSLDITFFAKNAVVTVGWGTSSGVMYRHPQSNNVMHIGANGEAKMNIKDKKKFFEKVVGTKQVFTTNDFYLYFTSIFADRFISNFLPIFNSLGLTYDKLDLFRKPISDEMKIAIAKDFERDWGVELTYFLINEFAIDEEETFTVEAINAAKELEEKAEAKAKELAREIERLDDKEYERKKELLALGLKDNAERYDMLKAVGIAAATSNGKENDSYKRCPKCTSKLDKADIYCPKCGNKIIK